MEIFLMVSFEEAGHMLDKAAESFPPAFFAELNGGIVLLPKTKRRPGGRRSLYILGEFHVDPVMGKYIALYYGSFVRVYGDLPAEEFAQKLYETLRHEFTHHLEVMAGEKTLERKDEKDWEAFLSE